MKINPVSSNNYTQHRNVIKNNNPSFGKITNVEELRTVIDKEVKQGKVSRKVADEVIQGLKNIKFSMAEAVDRYIEENNLSGMEKGYFQYNIENAYYPALKNHGLDYNDMPCELKYSLDKMKDVEYKLLLCQQRKYSKEEFLNHFQFNRCFKDIYQYSIRSVFQVWEYDDKEVVGFYSSLSEEPVVTEFLKSIIDDKFIEDCYYDYYAKKVCAGIPKHTTA